MKTIKAAIFDLDGVLVDTEYYQWQGWVRALKPYRVTLSKEEYFEYAGKRGDIIEGELAGKYSLSVKKGSLHEAKKKQMLEWFSSEKIKLMPYAGEAVEFFAKKRLKIALASGSPREEVMLKLKNTGLMRLFPVIVTGSDVERGKPYPDIYLLAAEKLRLKPGECIAFEDTQFGVQSAKDAGLACFAIPCEYTRKQDFSGAGKIFRDLKEAVEWTARHYKL